MLKQIQEHALLTRCLEGSRPPVKFVHFSLKTLGLSVMQYLGLAV